MSSSNLKSSSLFAQQHPNKLSLNPPPSTTSNSTPPSTTSTSTPPSTTSTSIPPSTTSTSTPPSTTSTSTSPSTTSTSTNQQNRQQHYNKNREWVGSIGCISGFNFQNKLQWFQYDLIDDYEVKIKNIKKKLIKLKILFF